MTNTSKQSYGMCINWPSVRAINPSKAYKLFLLATGSGRSGKCLSVCCWKKCDFLPSVPIYIGVDIALKREKIAKNCRFAWMLYSFCNSHLTKQWYFIYMLRYFKRKKERNGIIAERGVTMFSRVCVVRAHPTAMLIFCCHKCHTNDELPKR